MSNADRRRSLFVVIIILMVVLAVLVAVLVSTLAGSPASQPEETTQTVPQPSTDETTQSTTTQPTTDAPTQPTTDGPTQPSTDGPKPKPEPEATATIGATGDVLMHMPCVQGAQTANGYDFTTFFSHVRDYLTAPDYMVANLETTLAGLDNGYKYNGYPNFNCPDQIVYDLKAMGLDMFLTANNHTYDTSTVGFDRTQEIIGQSGLEHIGTKTSEEVADYLVKDINGIKIGMVCYTYETDADANIVRLNGGSKLPDGVKSRINTFHQDDLAGFTAKLSENIQDMTADGAEAIVLYIHWGTEYQTKQSKAQERFAQAACDLGVDVIVGGHPHVIQPMDLLTSTTDENHKTVCLYSTGNFMSNQRLGNISYVTTAHTEDGILFSFSFTRYSDGTVRLSDVELLPLWINLRSSGSNAVYDVLPLDTQIEDWKTQFWLADSTLKKAQDSYDRTMKIVGEGLEKVQQYLSTL